MIQIDIDQEVFEYLQKHARPFVDTPNTVLRNILKLDNKSQKEKHEVKMTITQPKTQPITSGEFVQKVLSKEFTETFQKKAPYRFMFESDNMLIYFQNFNQESASLWYRINKKPLTVLKNSRKKSFICLTNPAESIAYTIPVEKIMKQVKSSGWTRDYLEINIDHTSHKWKELDWNIKEFLKKY